MATKKKTKNHDVDMDMDFGDLDGLDDDMDFGDDGFDDGERSPSRSSVAKDLAKEAGEGFLDSVVKKTAEKALPPEYAANYSEVMDIASFTGEVVDKNKQQIDKSLFKLGQEVKKLLPMQIGLLDRYLARKEEEFAEYKSQSEEEMRSGAIASELGGIFDKQLDIQKAIESKRSAENQVESKERLVTTQMNLDMLRSIDANAATSAAFSTQISKEFFRKSLELQYKSFYVQADMLKTMRDHYKGFSIQFTNIEKNTGLPEFVKLKNTERLADIVRTNATQAVYKQLFDRNSYLDNVKKKVSRAVSEKVTSVTDTMGDVTDALSMMNDGGSGSGLRALAGIGASMGGSSIGEMVSDKISPKLQERFKDNKYINTGANYLSAFANSPATLMRSLRDKAAAKELEAEGQGSWSSKLYGLAKAGLDLTGEERIDTSVKKDNYLDHNQPAIFDNNAHRSLTEAIPLYLSHILKQNTDLTSMFYQANSKMVKAPSAGLLMYDYQGRKLTSSGELKAKIESSVFSQKSTKNRTEGISGNVLAASRSQIGMNKDLSKADRKQLNAVLNAKGSKDALANYMAKASSIKGMEMSYDNLILNKTKHADLQALIDQDPNLKKVLDVLQNHSAKDNTYIDKSLSDIENPYPIEALKQLFADASKLTRAKQPNTVTDKSATAISKAVSRFILNRGEDLSPGNITSRLAFSFFKPEEFTNEVRENITVLIDDVKRIQTAGDMLIQSSLISLLALVNQSLKSNFEIDPSVFSTLRNLYPEFVKQPKLTLENLTEGKLGGGGDEDYVPFAEVNDSTKASGRQMGLIRENVLATSGLESVMTRLKNQTTEFKQGLMDTKGSPTAMAEFLIKNAKDFKSTVAPILSQTGKDLQTSFDKMSTQVDALIKDGSVKAAAALVNELGAVEAKMDNYIKLTQEDIQQKTTQLEEANANLQLVTTDTRMQQAARKELDLFIKLGRKNMQAVSQVKASVGKSREQLTRLANGSGVSPTELVTQVRASILGVLATAKQQLADLEAAGAAQRMGVVA